LEEIKMQRFFIPHKLQVGDITHLSDKDSEYVISKRLYKVEDPIEVLTLDKIFLGIITDIDKASVEVEIIKKISDVEEDRNSFSVTVVQAISSDQRFNFFLEKSVELGVNKIIPIETEYSTISKKKAIKRFHLWQKILSQAREQSRNPFDVEILKPIQLNELTKVDSKYKICLATEANNAFSLKESLSNKDNDSSYTIAIGPERGWSVSDLEILQKLGFEFVKLGHNILRTETAGLVISSILNFKRGRY